jgi:hypothetical protein
MKQQPIGPENPGLTRPLAARFMLVVVAGFYLAGLVFVFMYAVGGDPLAHHIQFRWPSIDWPSLG